VIESVVQFAELCVITARVTHLIQEDEEYDIISKCPIPVLVSGNAINTPVGRSYRKQAKRCKKGILMQNLRFRTTCVSTP